MRSTYRYIQPTRCPDNASVGNLCQARVWLAEASKARQRAARRLRDTRGTLDGSHATARLEKLKADQRYREAKGFVASAHRAVEERANQLGYTTIRNKADTPIT